MSSRMTSVVKLKTFTLAAINPLTPNDPYNDRTAPLTSKRCILYIYSTNTGTEYFKHGIYSPFFFSSKCSLFHNSNVFGSCFIHILYTECAKILKNNSGAKRLRHKVIQHSVAAASNNVQRFRKHIKKKSEVILCLVIVYQSKFLI